MHEKDSLSRGKHNIGGTGQIFSMQSESIAEPMKRGSDQNFGSRVFASHGAHCLASLGWCAVIH